MAPLQNIPEEIHRYLIEQEKAELPCGCLICGNGSSFTGYIEKLNQHRMFIYCLCEVCYSNIESDRLIKKIIDYYETARKDHPNKLNHFGRCLTTLSGFWYRLEMVKTPNSRVHAVYTSINLGARLHIHGIRQPWCTHPWSRLAGCRFLFRIQDFHHRSDHIIESSSIHGFPLTAPVDLAHRRGFPFC